MNDFKYIVLNECYPRICSGAETHRDLAAGRKVTSAGFAQLYTKENGDFGVSCYGESVSLKIKSNPESDQRLLERLFAD